MRPACSPGRGQRFDTITQYAQARTLQRVPLDVWQVSRARARASLSDRGRREQPEPRLRRVTGDEEMALAQFSFDSARVFGGAPIAQCRGGLRGVARDGEGLVCDSFEVSLRGCQRRLCSRTRTSRTMTCAFVLQVLRNSIRRSAALYGTLRWCSRSGCTRRTA